MIWEFNKYRSIFGDVIGFLSQAFDPTLDKHVLAIAVFYGWGETFCEIRGFAKKSCEKGLIRELWLRQKAK